MKVTRFDGTDARRVLTGLITDDNVVRRVASRWKAEGLFGSRWENIIAGWCVDHSRKYGKAPGRDIETIFRATTLSNADEIEAIEKLLVGLSDSYEANGSAPASEYLIDLAGRLFKRTDLKRRAEAALADLERGDLGTAEQRLRLMHVISELTARDLGGYHAVLAVHAEGSIEAEKMQILRSYDSARALAYTKKIARID